jgi:hypothetical protein
MSEKVTALRDRKLPLHVIEFEARDAIMAALEPDLRPTIHGMTWTAWKQRYGKYCLDMARAGVTPSEALAAWKALCDARGYIIYSMRILQDYIVAAANRHAKAKVDPKNGCECSLSVYDCQRLHVDEPGVPMWVGDPRYRDSAAQ